MTWQPKLFRWRKVHDSKQLTVSVRQLRKKYGVDISETQEGSRVWANKWFQEERAKYDAERFGRKRAPVEGENLAAIAFGKPAGSLLEDKDVDLILEVEAEYARMVQENPAAADTPEARRMQAILVLYRRQFVPYFLGETEALSAEAREQPEVRRLTSALQSESAVAHSEHSVEHWVKLFLEKKRTELRSHDKHLEYGRFLREFVQHVGPSFDAGKIDAIVLHGFNSMCKAKVILPEDDPNRRSPKTMGERIRVAKEFTKWLRDMGVIEKEIRYERIRFPRKPKAPVHMTVEEIRLALALANERTKLFCLLSLNCAYTSVDIANLREHEIDWDDGTIAHPRCKAEGYPDESRVVARHKLWPETRRLLEKFRSGDKNHVLLSNRDTPLWRKGRHDMVWCAFNKLRNRMRKEPGYRGFSKSPKNLKATASRLIVAHSGNPALGEFFCQQTSKGVNLPHYSGLDVLQDQLFKAEEWLGRHLGLLPSTPATE
jgi:hypothetical protein